MTPKVTLELSSHKLTECGVVEFGSTFPADHFAAGLGAEGAGFQLYEINVVDHSEGVFFERADAVSIESGDGHPNFVKVHEKVIIETTLNHRGTVSAKISHRVYDQSQVRCRQPREFV